MAKKMTTVTTAMTMTMITGVGIRNQGDKLEGRARDADALRAPGTFSLNFFLISVLMTIYN